MKSKNRNYGGKNREGEDAKKLKKREKDNLQLFVL